MSFLGVIHSSKVLEPEQNHTYTFAYNIYFSKLYLHLLALCLIKDCFLQKEVSRNSAAITFTSSLLQKFSNRSIQNLFSVDKETCMDSR